jgi:hypothetical protein
MERKKRTGLASDLSSVELRRCGTGAEEKRRGGRRRFANLPESNGAEKIGQVRN